MSSPNEDVPLLFYHDEVDASVRVFAHECVWDQMEEYVGEEAACLYIHAFRYKCSEVCLGWEGERWVLTANAVMVFRVLGFISAGMKARMKFGTLPNA